MAFNSLEIRSIELFGFTLPKRDCWWYIVNPTLSKGWRSMDLDKFQKAFAKNVDHSYQNLFKSDFEDLDSSIHYTLVFDNQKKLFDLKLTNADGGDVLPEQRKEFFKSETYKSTVKRAYELLERGFKMYEDVVKTHLEAGELIETDETKIEAIEYMLNDQTLMRNFRLGKWARS